MSQPIRPLTHLRHVGLGVPDLAVAREFYTNLWGLEIVEEDSGIVFLASPASPENYIIRLRESANKRLDLVSFAGLDAAAVDALAARLGTAGVQIDREPATLDTPGGGYGFRFFDIDGRLVEVSADVAQKPYRELEPGEPIPQKLSHVVFNSTDVLATKGFYEQHLGFALSDWLADIMCFLRTSPQHHSIAISHGPQPHLVRDAGYR